MNAQLTSFLGLLRRYLYATACVVISIVLGVVAYFLWDHVGELQVIHEDRSKEGEAMLATLITGSTQRQELAAVHDATRRIEDNLVVESNLADNLGYFYTLEEKTKARLPELHQLNSPADASLLFKRVPYTVRAVGTYDQVAAFLLALETGPRLVNITAFSFARSTAADGSLSLDLNLEMLGKK